MTTPNFTATSRLFRNVDPLIPRNGPGFESLLAAINSSEDRRPGSTEQFSLKDYLCTITPSECRREEVQKLILAPSDSGSTRYRVVDNRTGHGDCGNDDVWVIHA